MASHLCRLLDMFAELITVLETIGTLSAEDMATLHEAHNAARQELKQLLMHAVN